MEGNAVVDKVNCRAERGKAGGVLTPPPRVMKLLPLNKHRQDLRRVDANLLPDLLELVNLVLASHCHHEPQEMVVNEV